MTAPTIPAALRLDQTEAAEMHASLRQTDLASSRNINYPARDAADFPIFPLPHEPPPNVAPSTNQIGNKLVTQAHKDVESYPGQPGVANKQYTFLIDPTLESHDGSVPSASGKRNDRRSRYSTLPTHIDRALTTLIDELESTLALRRLLQDFDSKVLALEQEIKIQKGKDQLASQERDHNREVEIVALREELINKQAALQELQDHNNHLARELEEAKTVISQRDNNIAAWKQMMKCIIDN